MAANGQGKKQSFGRKEKSNLSVDPGYSLIEKQKSRCLPTLRDARKGGATKRGRSGSSLRSDRRTSPRKVGRRDSLRVWDKEQRDAEIEGKNVMYSRMLHRQWEKRGIQVVAGMHKKSKSHEGALPERERL